MTRSRSVAAALLLVYAAAAALYGRQAWSQATPWIFPDETLHARAAQAIAGLNTASGAPISGVLTAVVTSPAWLLHDPVTAYDAAKLIGVFVMCLVVVPAYLLARLFVRRLPAFAAAVAALVIPGMSYSQLLMQEPVAYPYATFVLYVLASGLVFGSRGRLSLAFVLALAGPLIRTELVVLPLVVLLAVAIHVWLSDWARQRRAGWTTPQWITAAGVALLVLAAAAGIGAAVSVGWRVALQNPDDIIRYAALALGPFAAGVAVLPVLAGPAVILHRGAFPSVLAAAFAGFVLYVGAKEAFLATQPAFPTINDLLGERNLIYLSPLFFTATAIWAEAPRINAWALAAATLLLAAIFAWIPYVFAEESAPSSPTVVSISRIVGELSHSAVRALLVVATLVAATLLLLRKRTVFAAVAVVVIGWCLTGEIQASNRSREIGRLLVDAQPRPLDWIDRGTRGVPAVYVGQAKLRPPEILSLAFWNQSLTRLVTLGGAAAYGLIFETRIASSRGRLTDPARAQFVVSDEEVPVAGERIERAKRWSLVRVDGPVYVIAYEAGIWQDGWQEEESSYTRFRPRRAGNGVIRVRLSQKAGCGPEPHSRATITVTNLASKRTVTARTVVLQACHSRLATLTVPSPPFRVHVRIAPTFVPAELDSHSTDTRHLGARVTYSYVP